MARPGRAALRPHALRVLRLELLEERRLLSDGASDPLQFGTGLIPPTEEELAWEREHSIVAESVRLNELGLSRVNAQRLSEGELAISAIAPAAIGSEVVGRTEAERDATSAMASAVPQTTTLDLPDAVDNSQLPYFPPIRNQGSLGSCAQFATIYYMMTHMTAMARGWDVKNDPDDTHKFSPMWTYNLLKGGVDGGTTLNSGLAIAITQGVSSLADCPYDDNSGGEWVYDDPAVWRRAMDYRMDQIGVLADCATEAGLEALKTLLVDGYVVTFGTGGVNQSHFMPIGDDPATAADDPYVGKDVFFWTDDNSGHAMTIVGYNDNIWADINGNGIVDAGEKGGLADRKLLGPPLEGQWFHMAGLRRDQTGLRGARRAFRRAKAGSRRRKSALGDGP